MKNFTDKLLYRLACAIFILSTAFSQPHINVSPTSLNFSLSAGDTADASLTISNTGTSDLQWSIINFDTASLVARFNKLVSEIRQAIRVQSLLKGENSQNSIDTLASVTFTQQLHPLKPNIALIADDYYGYRDDVQSKLLATGKFNSVTSIQAYGTIPTLNQLKNFDAVLFWKQDGWPNFDPDTLGNNLADYIDQGGGVIVAVFSGQLYYKIRGRFDFENYWVIQPGDMIYGQRYLGIKHIPEHPILRNVTTFNGGYYSRRYNTSVVSGATRIADWTDGKPLIAERNIYGTRRVDLGFYPPSSTVTGAYGTGWAASTHGAQIMANALAYISNKFLKVDILSGTIAPSSNQIINVTADASELIDGIYRDTIKISSNDPSYPLIDVPVQVTILGTPTISVSSDTLDFGNGFVTYPDTLHLTINNYGTDTLIIDDISQSNPEFSIVNDTAFFIRPYGNKTILVRYSRASLGVINATLTISNNDPANSLKQIQLLSNTLQPPIISLDPDSLQFTLTSGDSTDALLTISNTGFTDLYWGVSGFDTASMKARIITTAKEIQKAALNSYNKEMPTGEEIVSVSFAYEMSIEKRNIALIAADYLYRANDVKDKLLATGRFNSITFIEAYSVTPTLEELLTYDAVLVWCYQGESFVDTQALGDNLADYIEAGGGVVTAAWSALTYRQIGGRFNSQNYWTIVPNEALYGPQTTLGIVYYPNHPLMNEVSIFNGGTSSYRYNSTITAGATRIANWSDGMPLIAERKVCGVNRVDLGFYPVSSSVESGLWLANTDGAKIMANALMYVGAKYVKVNPSGGTIMAGTNQNVTVNVYSGNLIEGNHTNYVSILSNDPANPEVQFKVKLTVNGIPSIATSKDTLDYSQGFVGYPDTLQFDISNDGTDTLYVNSIVSNNSVFVVIDNSPFSLWVNRSKTIQVIYSRATSNSQTGMITISSNDPVNPTVYVYLVGNSINPPIISANPDSLSPVILNTGDSTTRTINLSNIGGSDLFFSTKFVSPVQVSDSNFVYLPDTLYDALGYRWVVDRRCRVYGTDEVFDGGFELDYFDPYYDSALTEDGGREIVIGPYETGSNLNYIEVTRKLFVPANGAFIRCLEILNNNSPDEKSLQLAIDSDIDYDYSNYQMTSSGDVTFGYDDDWVVIDDNPDVDKPAVVHVMSGDGGALRHNYVYGGYNAGYYYYRYDITLPPYSKAIIMHFGAQRVNGDEGIAIAQSLMNLEGEALRGISIDEMNLIKNFNAQIIFSVLPDTGVVASASSEQLLIGYNSQKLNSGAYPAIVRINSNDPATPIKDIPISLTVAGNPAIQVSEDTLDFVVGYIGFPDTLSLKVSNEGTGPLDVTGVSVDNSEFVILDNPVFTLQINQYQYIHIQCKRSMLGAINGILTINSTDTSKTILHVLIFGTTLQPPSIAVNPDSVAFSLNVGDTATTTISIGNSGLGDLHWRIRNYTHTSQARIEAVANELRKEIKFKNPKLASVTADSSVIVLFSPTVDSTKLNVALVAADRSDYARDVQNKLLATDQFNSVTIIAAHNVTPTLEQLRAYDAVLVWEYNEYFLDGDALGNNLADYVDIGGGVVIAYQGGLQGQIGGRFSTDNYWVITPSSYSYGGDAYLGTIYIANHPVMEDVTKFYGGYYSLRYLNAELTNGSIRIADWTDGSPLIAERKINGTNRVDFGFYPPSNSAYSSFWDTTTHGAEIMANALTYVGRKILSFSSSSGTLTSGSSHQVEVKASAKTLFAGNYNHTIIVESNDPATPAKQINVDFSVNGNPKIEVTPTSFNLSLNIGDSTTSILQIHNTGTGALTWSLEGLAGDSNVTKLNNVVEEMRQSAVQNANSRGLMKDGDRETNSIGNAVSISFSTNRLLGTLNVLFIVRESIERAIDVRDKLLNTGLYNSITIVYESYWTPTVEQLKKYDAVLIWNSLYSEFYDPVTLGNNLADYIDSGGGVVTAYGAAINNYQIGGRFNSENYWAIKPDYGFGGRDSLGVIHQPNHPIMQGVEEFRGGQDSRRYRGSIVANATRIADWSDGRPLIAEKTINGVSRVDLGLYPPSSSVEPNYWDAETDGAKIIANALKYVAKNYLSLNPPSGMIASGSSQAVSVKTKTEDLIEKIYQDTIRITNNDTTTQTLNIPVQLTAIGKPYIAVDSMALNFGLVYQGDSDTLILNIQNHGSSALNVSNITVSNLLYSISGSTSFSLLPRNSIAIGVVFTPSGSGTQSGILTITSNAFNSPTLNVSLIGNGILPPVLATPMNGTSDIPIRQRLSWHPVLFASSYRLQISVDSLFGATIMNDSTITDTSKMTPALEVGTKYYWRVRAKSAMGISDWSAVYSFTTRFIVDLKVTHINLPISAYSGQNFEVQWIVTNVGAAGTNAPFWSDALWLFPDSIINFSTAIYLGGFQNVAYLTPSESYSNTATFILPRGITGTYYVFVITDNDNRLNEFNEENNRSYNYMQVNITPPPDLQVVSIIAPDNAFSGDSIDVMWSVKNLGTGSTITGQWWDRVYVSPDSVFNDSSAYKVGENKHTGILLPDSGYSTNKRVVVPNAIWGTHYIFVRTDDYNEIYENVWESNNISRTDSLIVTLSPTPDFVVTDFQIPSTGNSGQPITVQWTVQNQGPGSPFENGWGDRVYISRLSSFVLDSSVSIGTVSYIGGFEPESTYTKQTLVTIPNGYSGQYYLYVVTDWNNQVFEYTFEDNNVFRSTSAITMDLTPWPDLLTISLNVPTEVTAGQKVTIGWTVKNSGTGSTPSTSWIDNIYLSDTVDWFAKRAILLSSKLHSSPLAPNQTEIETSLVTIGTDIAGSYYVYVFVDANNSIYEHTEEGNNIIRSDEITILPYPPVDLVVKTVSAETTGSSGQPIKVRWTIQNIGSAKTLKSQWADELYLSTDTSYDGTDIKIGSFSHSEELEPNEIYSRDLMVTLPNGIQGNYHLLIKTDAHLAIKEVNENNNTGYSPKKINITLTPSPDFAISELTSPTQVQAGQPINLTWTVLNSGIASNLVTSWSDGVYLSSDTNYSPYDLRLGTISQTGILPASQNYTDSLTAIVPIYLSGDFYLIVCTDIVDEIYEHQAENNNWKVVPITIVMPPPSDLIVTNIEIPDTVECGTDISITWTLRNIGLYGATGLMYDAVYISSDTTWNVEDPLFGISNRYIDLAPGASMRLSIKTDLLKIIRADSLGEITSEMPGVSLGNYHAIVRNDIRNNIRESNDQNNTFASIETMNVGVPEIYLNTPMNTTLTLNQLRYYRVDVGDNLDLKLSLTSNVSSVSNEIYVSYEKAPTLNDFDYSATLPFTSNQELMVPSTKAGTYYILILARSFPGGVNSENISLLATALPFSIAGITPSRGGLGGKVTCTLKGAGFREGIKLYLKDFRDSLYESETVRFINTTEVKLRLNLENIPLGNYDVVAKNLNDSIVHLTSGFTVEPLNQGEIYSTHTIPNELPGRLSSMYTVQFAHTWNIDLPYLSVIIALSAPQKVDVTSERFKSFKSFVPETLRSKTLPYFDSDGWRIIPLTARDIMAGEVVQINLSLLQILFEHHKAPIKIIAYGMDKRAFIDNINIQTDIAQQLILDNSSIMDPSLVNLAQDYQTFSDSVKQFMISNDLLEPEDFMNLPKKSIIPIQTVKVASTQQSDPKVCTLVCTLTGCGAAGIDCLLGRAILAPSCVAGLTISCGYPMAGVDAGVFGCAGLASLINCLICYSLCPEIYQAVDPNDITGPTGYSDLKWISHMETLPYTIRYENDPEKANAPAKTVTVKLPLDSSLDARTFRLGSFGFGSFIFDVPANKAFYSKRFDVRDSLGVYVDFSAGIDLAKNEAFWILKSIDPSSGQSPTDPLLGFLLVNDSLQHGEGFLNFTIKPKTTSHSGEIVHAQASIVFDVNETINTPEIFNTIDADKPVSQVYPLTQTISTTTFDVRWSGSDSTGSGIKSYTIYVSVNNSPYTAWLTDVVDTSATFTGILNSKYAFYSIARDNVGNVEQSKTSADTYTIITGVKSAEELPKEFALYQNFPNPFNPITTIQFDIPKSSFVTLKVYNVLGQEVSTLVNEKKEAGRYNFEFRTSDFRLSSGVYFYRLVAGDPSFRSGQVYISTKKFVLMK